MYFCSISVIVSLFSLLSLLLLPCILCEINHQLLFGPNGFLKHDYFQFEEFIRRHNKSYGQDLIEKAKRYKIFKKNLAIIRALNQHELGSGVYGVTALTDLSQKEFAENYLGFKPELYTSSPPDYRVQPVLNHFAGDSAPDQFDWRTKPGVVSLVKNQGSCGSCWAFSATGNIEGVYGVRKHQSVSLSEQELVDCDTFDMGCGGGLPTNAFKTIIELGGIETESDYPYHGDNEKCHFNRTLSRVRIDSYVELPQKNETYMKEYLLENGPLSIGINAAAMQFYFGGISHPPHFLCPANLDHGVLIVGYGIGKTRILHQTQPYWIVKNSWGKTWGEHGYYRVYRGDNTCGLAMMVSSAVING